MSTSYPFTFNDEIRAFFKEDHLEKINRWGIEKIKSGNTGPGFPDIFFGFRSAKNAVASCKNKTFLDVCKKTGITVEHPYALGFTVNTPEGSFLEVDGEQYEFNKKNKTRNPFRAKTIIVPGYNTAHNCWWLLCADIEE